MKDACELVGTVRGVVRRAEDPVWRDRAHALLSHGAERREDRRLGEARRLERVARPAVGAVVDIDDDIAAGKRFHEKLKIKNMTKVYMPADKSGVVARYGSDTMPTTFVFDKSGVVRDVKKGFAEGDASGEYKKMKAQLEKLIK